MTLVREDTYGDRDAQTSGISLVRHEEDAYTWALQQAALLRTGRLDALDRENIADEIADVAGREYDKLESALTRVIQHLLKWDHQPERRSRSWVLSIKEHRARVLDQLSDHPGLTSMRDQACARAYRYGRLAALAETNLPEARISDAIAYGWNEIMTRPIGWPDE